VTQLAVGLLSSAFLVPPLTVQIMYIV